MQGVTVPEFKVSSFLLVMNLIYVITALGRIFCKLECVLESTYIHSAPKSC